MEDSEFIKKAKEYLEYHHIDCSGKTIEIHSGCYSQPMKEDIRFGKISLYTLFEIALALSNLTKQKVKYIE
jgi:hypothetical protein